MRRTNSNDIIPPIKQKIIINELIQKNLKRGDRLSSVREIAQKFGFSRSSVGRAVRELIREKVLSAKFKSGVFVDQITRSYKYLNRQGQVAVLLPTMGNAELCIINEIDKVFCRRNISVAAYTVAWPSNSLSEYIRNNLKVNHLSGIIIFHPSSTKNTEDRKFLLELQKKNIPVALIDTFWEGFFNVRTDYRRCAGLTIDYLRSLRHRTIIYIGLVEKMSLYVESEFMVQLDKINNGAAGVEIHTLGVVNFEKSRAEWSLETIRLLKKTGATAVFASNDYIACIMIEELQKSGIKVPGDVSVIGFGNSLGNNIFGFPEFIGSGNNKKTITTVDLDYKKKGSLAAQYIASCIGGDSVPAVNDILIEASLVKGDTCQFDSGKPHRSRGGS